jgi:hypothetical protein
MLSTAAVDKTVEKLVRNAGGRCRACVASQRLEKQHTPASATVAF